MSDIDDVDLKEQRLKLHHLMAEFANSLPEKPNEHSLGVLYGLGVAFSVMHLPRDATVSLEMVEQRDR